MKLIYKHNNLELVVEQSLIDELGRLSIKYYPNEFGGFLVGYYSIDFKTLYITDYILPKKYSGNPSVFERQIDGIIDEFVSFFKNEKKYYIGEWHTHPNGSTMYSQTDLNAMIKTADCETVQIKNPILLILSIDKNKIKNYTFYIYSNKKLIPYE